MAGLDLGGVRDAVSLLPRLLAELKGIRQAVEELNDEVRRMRQGVDRIDEETKAVRDSVRPLDARLNEVVASIERLEPQLSEVSNAIHPLRRATGLLTRRGGREAANGILEEDQISSGENVSQAEGSPDP